MSSHDPANLPPKVYKALEKTRIQGILINLQPDRGGQKPRRKDS
ncbi:hypothetical protein [Mycolicibacterium diernhoferi]|nr:hypothetical protein [Mycolicibacterium diernhoferi]